MSMPAAPARRSQLAISADAAARLMMCHTLSGRLPLYIVTEYPKSGGSWFAQMLAAYLDVPFPRNRRARLESSVMHGHYLYSRNFRNAFCVVRDGRDVMVSAYFHYLFQHERNSPRMVARYRAGVPFRDHENVHENLPRFIEYMFTAASAGRFHFRWDEFVRSWHETDTPIVRYERLLAGAAHTVAAALKQGLGIEPDMQRLREIETRFAFENQARRRPGIERPQSFLRKGVAGDWRHQFSREAREVFDHYAGAELIQLGYENDRKWVAATKAAATAGEGDDRRC